MIKQLLLPLLAVAVLTIGCGPKAAPAPESVPTPPAPNAANAPDAPNEPDEPNASNAPNEPNAPEMAWIYTDPIQCGGNAWEQMQAPGQPEEEQVRNLFRQGYNIELGGYKQYKVHDNVCEACYCPRGDRIEVQVPKELAELLITKGWKLSGSE